MEFVVAKALKPSLRREFFFQQTVGEEQIWCLNSNAVVAGGGGGEDFSVEDLFDFSNGESLHFEPQKYHEEEEEEEEKDNSSVSSHSHDSTNSNSAGVSYDSIFSTELTVPAGDLDDLEWVSHIVDDSHSLPEISLLFPILPEQKFTFAQPEKTPLCFPSITTRKNRSVKSRKPNPRVRSLSPLLTRSSSPSSCSSVLSSSTAPPPVAPPAKKQKRKAEEVDDVAVGVQSQWRCSHCQVQKTPQWRTGPLGAKTLCNACGVRYKSGRLCSEYRPACSPTFCGEIHSNSHRKVLEMRRRKEVVGPDSGLAQTQMVSTC